MGVGGLWLWALALACAHTENAVTFDPLVRLARLFVLGAPWPWMGL
jgi:hypothetical protein